MNSSGKFEPRHWVLMPAGCSPVALFALGQPVRAVPIVSGTARLMSTLMLRKLEAHAHLLGDVFNWINYITNAKKINPGIPQ
jgi:hypothetical protein